MARREGSLGGSVGGFGDSAMLILLSLAEGPKHGHALIKDIEHFSGVSLGPGTLYGAVARLEKKRLIEALAEEGRRRPYRITAAGEAVLRDQVASVERVAQAGRLRLGLAGS